MGFTFNQTKALKSTIEEFKNLATPEQRVAAAQFSGYANDSNMDVDSSSNITHNDKANPARVKQLLKPVSHEAAHKSELSSFFSDTA